jgi:hypothetical protein
MPTNSREGYVKGVAFLGGLAIAALAVTAREKESETSTPQPVASSDKVVQLLEMKAKCSERGKEASREFRKQWYAEVFPYDPEFAYNEARATCLYADHYLDIGGNPLQPKTAREVSFVMDIFSNETLAEYVAYNGRAIETSLSKEQFATKRRELMGR